MSNWFLLDCTADTDAAAAAIAVQKPKIIVLASASGNRLELLKQIGINPLVCPSECEEDLPRNLPLAEFVEQTAKQKCMDVVDKLTKGKIDFDVVIGCDTMISVDGQMIGKPRDEQHAMDILHALNGRSHAVRTGVCLVAKNPGDKCVQQQEPPPIAVVFSVESLVEFGQLSAELIQSYIRTGEPMGRAGAYAIQGKGAALVKSIHGSYSNVVGLPVYELATKLRELFNQQQNGVYE